MITKDRFKDDELWDVYFKLLSKYEHSKISREELNDALYYLEAIQLMFNLSNIKEENESRS